jgi:AraC family ethanolamine operon transcriptional activator
MQSGLAQTPVFSGAFRDIDEMASAIRVAEVAFTAVGNAPRASWIASAELPRSVFQSGGFSTPHLARASIDPARVVVYLVLGGELRVRGRYLDRTQVGLYRPGAEHQHAARAPFAFALAALQEDDLASAASALRGTDWVRAKDSLMFVRPEPEALRTLRRQIRVLATVAQRQPDRLRSRAARRAFEKDLLDEVARALASAAPVPILGRPSSHSAVVSAVEELLSARAGQPVTVTEMCRAARTTERTLRNAFTSVYGMGPNRFARLRRVNEVHRLLRAGRPEDSVAGIATELGIWDLGRFAAQYRALFRELPSQTLVRAQRRR